MKAGELTGQDVLAFLRLDEGEDISPDALLAAAKSFVRGYTGLSDEEMDEHEDITLAILALCADLYENRTVSGETSQANRVVEAILGMYRKNLI